MTEVPTTVLSAPGKTFLVGEYLALSGGPALVLTTAPRFELRVFKSESTGEVVHPFQPQSPAGRLLSRYTDKAKGYKIEFSDPHNGLGGLGASSAQFALSYFWLRGGLDNEFNDWETLLNEYRECAWGGEGTPPSGADLVAQVVGGVCWFDGLKQKAQQLSWNFERLGFTLVRTGTKLPTHEHLKEKRPVPVEALRAQVGIATRAFEDGNESLLVESVRATGTILAESGLCASKTREILSDLHTYSEWVLAAKGCGAMGADVILILHERAHADRAHEWAREKSFSICGTDQDIALGLRER